jgi:hypothetical protein
MAAARVEWVILARAFFAPIQKTPKQLAPRPPFPLGRARLAVIPSGNAGNEGYGMSMRRDIGAIGRRAATARPDAAPLLRILLLIRP